MCIRDRVEATKPEEPSSTQPQQEPRPEPEPKPESVAAPKEKPPRQRRFARFRNLYESRDGGLCVFEDEHGHLVACLLYTSLATQRPMRCG